MILAVDESLLSKDRWLMLGVNLRLTTCRACELVSFEKEDLHLDTELSFVVADYCIGSCK